MNEIAVVICNFNKKDFVLDCIESVFKSDFKNFDLIVVDNASSDGSVESIKEKYGDKLTLLINEENFGGSGGFNRGMQCAMDKGAYKYIHLLDNDVVVDKDAIGGLYGFMEEHHETGVCGSLVLRMDQPDFIQDYGSMIDIENLGVKPLYHSQKESGSLPEYVECDYVAACSAMYRASVLEKTGIIDKDFFLYWDDMSLSWEIRLAGHKVNACKKSRVWHMHGWTEEKSTFGMYYFFRNKLYSFIKYSSDSEYENLCENLVKRLFRSFAVNFDNPERISTYFHALNDVMNDIRGKAEDFKILPIPKVNAKFENIFNNKRNILLICGTYDFDFNKLIAKLKSVTDAAITIQKNDLEVPEIGGAKYESAADVTDYDAAIYICTHILDEKEYNRSYKYIDRHMNQILDDKDFDFFENIDANYSFFHSVFYNFIKSKFDALRIKYRNQGA